LVLVARVAVGMWRRAPLLLTVALEVVAQVVTRLSLLPMISDRPKLILLVQERLVVLPARVLLEVMVLQAAIVRLVGPPLQFRRHTVEVVVLEEERHQRVVVVVALECSLLVAMDPLQQVAVPG
jgi:hypothetical protein